MGLSVFEVGGISIFGNTLPATTFTGDISIGANRIKTTNVQIYEGATNTIYFYGIASGKSDIICQSLAPYGGIEMGTTANTIRAVGADNAYFGMTARDNGVANVEVARVQGAADPYFQATLPMRILPVTTGALPATPLEGMLAYDVTAHKLKVYVATAWETVTSA